MTRTVLFIATLLCAPFVLAQATLGAMLDAGAKRLTVEEFQQELVQRTLVGPAPTGARLELMYVASGTIQGAGTVPLAARDIAPMAPLTGVWKVGDNATICTSMNITYGSGIALVLPSRCQHWFKLGDKYYFADSDTDRSTK